MMRERVLIYAQTKRITAVEQRLIKKIWLCQYEEIEMAAGFWIFKDIKNQYEKILNRIRDAVYQKCPTAKVLIASYS